MRITLSFISMAILLSPAFAVAPPEVMHFRMMPDPGNGEGCDALDPGLRGLHTVTLTEGVAIITSAGGLQGRLTRQRAGVYGITFELTGRRLDGVAFLGEAPRLVVTERGRPCRWTGKAE